MMSLSRIAPRVAAQTVRSGLPTARQASTNAPSITALSASSVGKDTKLLKTDGAKTSGEKPALTKSETHEAKKGIDAVTSHPNPDNTNPFFKIFSFLNGQPQSTQPSKDALASGNFGMPTGKILFRRETPAAVTPSSTPKAEVKADAKTDKPTTPAPTVSANTKKSLSTIPTTTTPATAKEAPKDAGKKVEASGKKATA